MGWLNSLSIPAVLFWGQALPPLFPRCSAKLYSYVGEPLQLPCIPEPSAEQVDLWHGKYVAALQALFDTNKAAADGPMPCSIFGERWIGMGVRSCTPRVDSDALTSLQAAWDTLLVW